MLVPLTTLVQPNTTACYPSAPVIILADVWSWLEVHCCLAGHAQPEQHRREEDVSHTVGLSRQEGGCGQLLLSLIQQAHQLSTVAVTSISISALGLCRGS
jgi:hypothetical protein